MKRCRFIHCSFKKKRERSPKRCRFNGAVGFLFPLDAQGKGRRRFFLPCFSLLPLSPKPQKDTDITSLLTYHVVEEGRGRSLGRFGVAAPWPPRPRTPWTGVVGGPPPLCFTYKYRGGKLRK